MEKSHVCKINKGKYKYEQMPGICGLIHSIIMCIHIKLNNYSENNWGTGTEGCLLKAVRLEAKKFWPYF